MKLLLLAVVLMLSLHTPAYADDAPFTASEGVLIMGHSLDLATSQRCIGSGRCVEANPALARFKDPLTFTLAKTSVAMLGLMATKHIHNTHPKLATWTNFIIGGTFCALAGHNYRVGGVR